MLVKPKLGDDVLQTDIEQTEAINRVEDFVELKTANLSLVNDWRPVQAGTYGAPKVQKNGNIVHLIGIVTGGREESVIATLPDEYRPKQDCRFAVAGVSSPIIQVNKSGEISHFMGGVTNLFLSGVSFTVL